MRARYGKWPIVFIAGAGLLLALGCARAQPPAQPAPGPQEQIAVPDVGPKSAVRGGIHYRVGQDPIGWDPHATTAARTNGNVTMALEGLTQMITWDGDQKVDPGDLRVLPLLAESWEQKSDTEFVFKLRQGVMFKDNDLTLRAIPDGLVKDREMTAEDVVYSYKRAANPLQTTRETNWKAQSIKEVVALDRYTVRVVLREAYGPFLLYISGNPFWIVPHEVYEKFGNMKRAEANIGTGPFILEEYKPGVTAKFKRNPDYYQKGLPYLDGVHGFMKFSESALAALRSGQLDAGSVTWGNLESVRKSNPDMRYESERSASWRFVAFRTDQKPFDDIRVRRAMSMGMDREGLAQSRCLKYAHLGCEYYPTGGGPPGGLREWYVGPAEWPAEHKQWWTYDPQRAKELLAEAGYPNGFDTINNVGGADYYGANVIEDWEISTRWFADIGVRAPMKAKLYTLYATSTWLGDYEGIAGPSGSHSYTEPNDFTYRQYYPGHSGNVSHVDDPVMTKLLLAQLHTYDLEERQRITRDIVARNVEMVWFIDWPSFSSNTGLQPWYNDRVNKFGGCWGNTATTILRAWIDPSKKPKAALTIAGDGMKVAAANPQALGVSNPVGRTGNSC